MPNQHNQGPTYVTLFVLFLCLMALITGCTNQAKQVPIQPPPAPPVVAKVAIPVPCEIEQIPQPDYPANTARLGDDIFTLAKIIAADRRVRMGETEELRAANESPCP